MDASRRVLAALILGGAALVFLFSSAAPVGLVLHIVALVLTAQAFRQGESKPLCLASFVLNGIAALLALAISLFTGLWHMIF